MSFIFIWWELQKLHYSRSKPSLPPGPSFFSLLSFLGHRWCVARSWKEKHPTSHVSSFILLMGQQPWAVTFRRVPRPLLPTIYVGQEASGDSIHQLPFPQVTQALRTVSPRADPHPREESSGRISLPTAPRTRGGVGWGGFLQQSPSGPTWLQVGRLTDVQAHNPRPRWPLILAGLHSACGSAGDPRDGAHVAPAGASTPRKPWFCAAGPPGVSGRWCALRPQSLAFWKGLLVFIRSAFSSL